MKRSTTGPVACSSRRRLDLLDRRFRSSMKGPTVVGAREIPPTRKSFEVDFCTVARWHDGQIVEENLMYDLVGFLQQIGLSRQASYLTSDQDGRADVAHSPAATQGLGHEHARSIVAQGKPGDGHGARHRRGFHHYRTARRWQTDPGARWQHGEHGVARRASSGPGGNGRAGRRRMG